MASRFTTGIYKTRASKTVIGNDPDGKMQMYKQSL